MQVVDTSAAQNYPTKGDDTAFVPAATYGFVTATKTLTVTEAASAYGAGDSFKRINVEVFDQNGAKKTGSINAAAGNVAIDLDAATSLDMSGPINIKVTFTSTLGHQKDGWYYGLLPNADASGALSFEK